jgi:YD repeat-containing protein
MKPAKRFFRFQIILHFVGVSGIALFSAFSSQAENVTYTYDALNRLNRVQYTDGTVIQYTYDPAGNRTSRVVSKPTQPLNPNNGPNQTLQKSDLTSPDSLPEEGDAADLVPRC